MKSIGRDALAFKGQFSVSVFRCVVVGVLFSLGNPAWAADIPATVTLSNLSQAYDGTPKAATCTTDPAELAVEIRYSNSLTPPTNAGSYAAVCTVTQSGYSGSDSQVFVIAKADQTVAFNGQMPIVTVGSTGTLAATATSGGAVSFGTSTPSKCSVAGSIVTGLATGTCTVTADQTGTTNYNAAPQVTADIDVGAARKVILLGWAESSTTSCRYDRVDYDDAGNVTVNCGGVADGSGTLTLSANRVVEGQAVTLTADCGSYGSSLFVQVTGAGSDTLSWTPSSAVLDCSTETKQSTLTFTAATNSTADAERGVSFVLSTQASGGTSKSLADLTVVDDMALLNVLGAAKAWANTDTPMIATGVLGATPAAAGYQKLTYGDLYWDATGKWTYVEVPDRTPLSAGSSATDSYAVPLSGGGTKTISVTLYGANVASRPSAPTIGTATQESATSIRVTFSAPSSWGSASNGTDATAGSPAYTVTCGSTQTNTGATSPVVVGGLSTGGTYACSVVATNSAGMTSTPSNTSNSVTLAASVPGAPTLTRVASGNARARVLFTPPASDGGAAISGYTASCTASATTKTGTAAASPVTVTGLTNGTTYSCSVHATNSAGNGAESSSANVLVGRSSIAPILSVILE